MKASRTETSDQSRTRAARPVEAEPACIIGQIL